MSHVWSKIEDAWAIVQDKDVWTDVFSAACLMLLLLLVWLLGWKRFRPAKYVFEWAWRYPLLSGFYVVFTLMTWGILGTDFGVRTLMLSDDKLVQFLCGFALIAVFLRLSFQYIVLDRSRERWFRSLDQCLEIQHMIQDLIRMAMKLLPRGYRRFLNGFYFGASKPVELAETGSGGASETMSIADLQRLLKVDVLEQPGSEDVRETLNSDRFRIAMAPVITDFYSAILVVFLGLVPVLLGFQTFLVELGEPEGIRYFVKIIQLLSISLYQRVFWLLGVLAGVFMARGLVRVSAERFRQCVMKMLSASEQSGDIAEDRLKEIRKAWPHRGRLIDPLRHAVTEARKRDAESQRKKESEDSRWYLVAIVLLLLAAFAPNGFFWRSESISPKTSFLGELFAAVLSYAKILAIGSVSALILSYAILYLVRFVALLFEGLKRLINSFAALTIMDTDRNPGVNIAILCGTFGGLAGIAFLTVPSDSFEKMAYTFLAVSSSIWIHMRSTSGRALRLDRRPKVSIFVYWIVLVLAVPFVTKSWGTNFQIDAPWFAYLLGILKYLFVILVGSMMVRWTMALFDPLISYPVTAIWGFLAFAAIFVELPERSQAQIPAAFTVIYFAGVVASCFTVLLHSRSLSDPQRLVFLGGLVVLIIGQGWTTAPNQYKMRFPGLDNTSVHQEFADEDKDALNYYENPVRLNSEAYFRITNRSVIKLHMEAITKRKNKDLSELKWVRLASGLIPEKSADAGAGQNAAGHGLSFRFREERNMVENAASGSDYLRLRENDPLELIRIETTFLFRIPGRKPGRNKGETNGQDGGVPPGPAIEIQFVAQKEEQVFPAPKDAARLYDHADSISFSLVDSNELDSGIRVTLSKQRNEWKAKFMDEPVDSKVTSVGDVMRMEGELARRVIEAVDVLERDRRSNRSNARVRSIDRTIVTASWPVRVGTINEKQGVKTYEVIWLENPEKNAENGVEKFDFGTIDTKEFLHFAYIIAAAQSDDLSVSPGKLIAKSADEGIRSAAKNVLDLIRENSRVEGISNGSLVSGDSLRFEILGWESPVGIADLSKIGESELKPPWNQILRPYLLTEDAIWTAIRRSPESLIPGFDGSGLTRPFSDVELAGRIEKALRKSIEIMDSRDKADATNKSLFAIRQSTGSGIFLYESDMIDSAQSQDSGSRIAYLTNADRIRENDRLVLKWYEDAALRTATYKVMKIAEPAVSQAGQERYFHEIDPKRNLRKLILKPVEKRASDIFDEFQNALPAETAPVQKIAGSWSRLELLDNYEVLDAWKMANVGQNPEGGKPKLVIVTVSGGGIRSEVWTATVLDQLVANLGNEFPKSIRLITGASGGMVAASDFVGNVYAQGLRWNTQHSPISVSGGVSGGESNRYLTRNQLDSVIGQMFYSDFPGILNPLPRKVDRGRTLERSWARIAREGNGLPSPFERSIRELAAGEAAGWRPSIVFTPMMVEDGRRLLISNLDLSFVTRNLSAMLMEENRRKIKHAAYETDSTDRLIDDADDLLSLSAVEFFRIFPEAWRFSIGTATRMSASFPWVAPAVSIPTIPPRRIVDAGYYDNYGVNLASLWMAEMRDWLHQNTSGLLLVQIRDHESQSRRTDIDFDAESGKNASNVRKTFDAMTLNGLDRNVSHVLHPFLTPLSGISNARSWTMSFRNDEQVELLDELFNVGKYGEEEFFRTVVFECPVEASLSWSLSHDEIESITSGFGKTPLAQVDTTDDSERQVDPIETPAQASRRIFELRRKSLNDIGIEENRLNRLSDVRLKELHDNVLGNRKRMQLLKSWWER